MALRRRGKNAVGALAIAALAAGMAASAGAAEGDGSLPVPRFVSLHADKVNLRAGPGNRYPIDWILTRKDMPVEITAQFEHWRRVRDWEGTQGWVHQRMLSGKRGVIVKGGVRVLYRQPDTTAAVVARLEPGVVASLLECEGPWCRVDAGEARGWLRRTEVWGVYPEEKVP